MVVVVSAVEEETSAMAKLENDKESKDDDRERMKMKSMQQKKVRMTMTMKMMMTWKMFQTQGHLAKLSVVAGVAVAGVEIRLEYLPSFPLAY